MLHMAHRPKTKPQTHAHRRVRAEIGTLRSSPTPTKSELPQPLTHGPRSEATRTTSYATVLFREPCCTPASSRTDNLQVNEHELDASE